MKKALIVGALVVSFLECSAATLNMVVCTPGAKPYDENGKSGGSFYGYKTDTLGPGDDAWELCLDGAQKYHAPMFLILDKDGSQSATFINTANDKMSIYGDRYLNQWINGQRASYNTRFCYYRGTTAKACQDAWAFAKRCGVPSGSFVYVAYYRYKNGSEQIQCGTMSTVQAFEGVAQSFASQYNLAKDKTEETTVKFDCGSSVGARLEATKKTERIFVPFFRASGRDKAERTILRVGFANEQTVDIKFDWTNGQERAEVDLYMSGRHQPDATHQLFLVNASGVVIGSNCVTCVDLKGNSFSHPYYANETNTYTFGTWTLDYDLVTNAVAVTNGYLLKVTGSPVWNAQAIALKSVFDSDEFREWCVSNNIGTVLNETSEPGTGASLLSHNVASNKTSGTPFISSKGISALDAAGNPVGAKLPVGGEFTVELIRPNGKLVGRLSPYLTQGKWFVEENMQRLNDLLVLAKDETEVVNNDPATTPLTVAYGQQASVDAAQTLMISDTVDVFTLTGVPANTPFVIGYEKLQTSSAEPTLAVCAWNDPGKKSYTALSSNISSNVYVATPAQVANGLFVTATAWTNEVVKTTAFGSISWLLYAPTVLPAPENRGEIGFGGDLDQKYIIDGEDESVEIVVKRTGYTGAATATVRLDRSCTQIPDSYLPWLKAWENESTNVTWAANEGGEKSIWVTVKQDVTGIWGESYSNLAFTVEVEGADPAVSATNLVLGISQKLDQETPSGTVAIESPASDSTIYVYGGALGSQRDPFVLGIRRYREYYGKRDAWTAYGVITATVAAVGCTFDPATVVWPSGEGTIQATPVGVVFPDVDNKRSYQNVTLTLSAMNFNGRDVTDYGSNTLTVCVLPHDSREFTRDISCPNAVQYVAIDEFSILKDWAPDQDLEVLGVKKISGDLPPGVSATAVTGIPALAAEKVAALSVSGSPTKAGTYESLWWMTLRRKSDKSKLMTKPCRVTINVKSLADDPKTGEKGLIKGFETARTWTGLPLVDNETKRLAGLLDMTVSKNGRTTAKWRKTGGKAVSFSAVALSGSQRDEQMGTNVFVEVRKMQRGSTNDFSVTFWNDGTIVGLVEERDGEGAVPAAATFFVPTAEVWSKSHTAEDWDGNYTLAFPHDDGEPWHANTLCTGAVTLRVKFDTASQWKTGKATFAGYLPNGKGVSGTAVFVPVTNGAEVATLPIFHSTAADTFAALVDVGAADATERVSPVAANETVSNFWQHVENGIEAASYDNDYFVIGTRYEAGNWEETWQTDYGTNALAFALDGSDVAARVAAKGAVLKVADKGELKMLSFSLNKGSGVASGSFRDRDDVDREPVAEGKTATWRGVAIPGGEAFTAGAYWYTTVFEFQTDNGVKTRSVKAGGAVSLEPAR